METTSYNKGVTAVGVLFARAIAKSHSVLRSPAHVATRTPSTHIGLLTTIRLQICIVARHAMDR
eukprot:5515511-Pyramimonas_sp.AAC.1